MPSWKKIIQSGSNAALNSLVVSSGSISARAVINNSSVAASHLTGSFTGSFIGTHIGNGSQLTGIATGSTAGWVQYGSTSAPRTFAGTSSFQYTAATNTLSVPKIRSSLEIDHAHSFHGQHAASDFMAVRASDPLEVGELCYLSTGGQWSKASAITGSSLAATGLLGMSLSDTPGGASSFPVLTRGTLRSNYFSSSLSTGQPIYMATANGKISHNAPTGSGEVVRLVGYALDVHTVFFAPKPGYIILN